MGAEGAVNILHGKHIQAANNPAAEKADFIQKYREQFLNPYVAAKAGYIDDVIEPRETRPAIYAALSALRDKSKQPLPRKHGNMPV